MRAASGIQLDIETGRNVCKSRGLLGYAQVGVQTRDLDAMIADMGQGAMIQSAPAAASRLRPRTRERVGPVNLASCRMHPQLVREFRMNGGFHTAPRLLVP
jgi:hypothetical protein